MPIRQRRAFPPAVPEFSLRDAVSDGDTKPNTCPNCRWSDKAPGGWKCRRLPPVVHQARPGEALFPMVQADDWCGEYEQ